MRMDFLTPLLTGFGDVLTPMRILYCTIGVSWGMVVGILPGLGPSAGTALLIPLTYGMDPSSAIIMLGGIFYGAMYGGTITSVLINVPGEAATVVTCIDGYQMAKQGRAGVALGIAAMGSFIGGNFAVLLLTIVGPPLAKYALKFGPPEFFSLMVLGLSLITGLMGKSVLRSLISGFLGLAIGFIGIDPVSGVARFTFGQAELLQGADFIAIAMGAFGVGEILENAENPHEIPTPARITRLFPKREEWIPSLKAIVRGALTGSFFGLIPGIITVVPTFASYVMEKRFSRHPERFGKGAIEGVAGPETANNAHSQAAMVPLFTLGIPGTPAIAVIMGALMIHGLSPGPQLFQQSPRFVWAVIASFYIGNLILLIFNLPLARFWALFVRVPYKILSPIILIFCILGAFSINNSIYDLGIMMAAGILGYLMKKLDFPIAPLIIALILGPQMERSLLQSLEISAGSFAIIFNRPISLTLLIVAALFVISGAISEIRKKRGSFVEDVDA
jgi:putative tricarboxylic transport membrane protein